MEEQLQSDALADWAKLRRMFVPFMCNALYDVCHGELAASIGMMMLSFVWADMNLRFWLETQVYMFLGEKERATERLAYYLSEPQFDYHTAFTPAGMWRTRETVLVVHVSGQVCCYISAELEQWQSTLDQDSHQ